MYACECVCVCVCVYREHTQLRDVIVIVVSGAGSASVAKHGVELTKLVQAISAKLRQDTRQQFLQA